MILLSHFSHFSQVSPESKSLITTLEGLLVQHIENLEAGQPVRRIMDEA